MNIKSFLLDMDGLMIDSEYLSYEIIRDIIAEHNYTITEELYRSYIGKSNNFFATAISEAFQGVDGKAVLEEFRKRYFDYVDNGKLTIKKGIFELLDEMDARKIKYAVASSNRIDVITKNLTALKLLNRVDIIVCDGMVAKAKPDPDIFIEAAKRLSTLPENCMVLEDSYAGIRAAYAAGCHSIMIPDMIQPDDEISKLYTYKMDSLFDVIDYIKRNDLHG